MRGNAVVAPAQVHEDSCIFLKFQRSVRSGGDGESANRKERMQVSRTALAVRSPDGKAVLEVGGRSLFELSPVAANIWAKLIEGLPAQEIIGQLTAQFNVPEERVRNDVTSLIELLRRHLLVTDTVLNTRRDPLPLAE